MATSLSNHGCVARRRQSALYLAVLTLFPTILKTNVAHAQEAQLNPITVSASRDDTLRARNSQLAPTPGSSSLLTSPYSISIVTRETLDMQQAQTTADAMKNEASAGSNYSPIGYYENFVLRGFTLSTANSYLINGATAVGEQIFALDNKERVEVLKGTAGIVAGNAAPGGLINYVTKRPAKIASGTMGLTSTGGSLAQVDYGRFFGEQNQFGMRLNLATESIHPTVRDADGWRNFVSGAFDWKPITGLRVELDAEYQNRSQRSVPGYQLLGGTQLPDLSRIDPDRLLGVQSWSKPVSIESTNLGARAEYDLNPNTTAYVRASHSKAVIDDNIAFPYGGDYSKGAYFKASGDYEIYDFRSHEKRQTDAADIGLKGSANTGVIKHDWRVGLGWQQRTRQRGQGVNEYVGSGNIYTAEQAFAPSSQQQGPLYTTEETRQYSLYAQDTLSLDRWQLHLGLRHARLHEIQRDKSGGAQQSDRSDDFLLPMIALAYQPAVNWNVYTSWGKGLEAGGTAPANASNSGTALPSKVTHQLEAGVRHDWNKRLLTSLSIFRASRPYEYFDNWTLYQSGKQVHTGIELNAVGSLTSQLRLIASLTGLRAEQMETDVPAFNGRQVQNVPRVSGSLFGEYAFAQFPGLAAQAGIYFAGKRPANRDNSVMVGGYARVDAGLSYATKIGKQALVMRANVDNVFNRRYWRDVGEGFGDGYVFPSLSRAARFSMTLSY